MDAGPRRSWRRSVHRRVKAAAWRRHPTARDPRSEVDDRRLQPPATGERGAAAARSARQAEAIARDAAREAQTPTRSRRSCSRTSRWSRDATGRRSRATRRIWRWCRRAPMRIIASRSATRGSATSTARSQQDEAALAIDPRRVRRAHAARRPAGVARTDRRDAPEGAARGGRDRSRQCVVSRRPGARVDHGAALRRGLVRGRPRASSCSPAIRSRRRRAGHC